LRGDDKKEEEKGTDERDGRILESQNTLWSQKIGRPLE